MNQEIHDLAQHIADDAFYPTEIKRAAKRIIELNAATSWMPCSESLPEETDKYWVTIIRDGEPTLDERDYFAHEKYWGQGAKPLAWMPKFKPKPWVIEEKGENG